MSKDTKDESLLCHRCAAILQPGRHDDGTFYIVRIEAFADPSPPRINGDETLESIGNEIDELIEQMKGLSERELMDQVHRSLTLTLCSPCYRQWIERPTG